MEEEISMGRDVHRHKTIDPESLPRHYDHQRVESHWDEAWSDSGTYRYRPDADRDDTFVVDTPPPTVSGSLHIGHAFSYTQTDVIVRFQRMRGKNIFYPMGWDDNGLPTERRVQNYFHVTCDPALPYLRDLRLGEATAARREQPPLHVSRQNFIELCGQLTREDEQAFTRLWHRIGLSVDWNQEYATIGTPARRAAQLSFLDLYARGHIYNQVAPTLWDIDFQTAVAQAELEDREEESAYYRIELGVQGDDRTLIIATTRPELLAACVGITAHPDDPRYRGLFGRRAVTPLFHLAVPIFPSRSADPDKGTGILMVCTFGDSSDVEWWKERNLPLRQVIGPDGRLAPVDFSGASLRPDLADSVYREIQGKGVREARRLVDGLLRRPELSVSGERPALIGEPEPVRHAVKYYEKGRSPIEFMTTRQWFVRLLDKKEMLIEQGGRVRWHPEHMGARYRNWAENLQFDWCISRQRYFGVSFPVWYPLDDAGTPDYGRPIIASADALPVDPMIHSPPGYREDRRGRPGGFIGERDVFDTWFTSSLTPQLVSRWTTDPQWHGRLFPMDVRPQSHDIIRTWAFYTIVKAALHENAVPWTHALISGWILDPDRKKMSKSRGGAVTPEGFLDRYSADAVRYWASEARLGTDRTFDEAIFGIGRRLVTKLYNAARFVFSQPAAVLPITRELDRAFIRKLRLLIEDATLGMESFDYSSALERTESFFWAGFTDAYLELVKNRAKDSSDPGGQGSAVATLRTALRVLLRLFAPILPFITEEIWSWVFAEETGWAGIHRAPWPAVQELEDIQNPADEASFDLTALALGLIHKRKTLAKRSVGAHIETLELEGPAATIRTLRGVQDDLRASARIGRLIVSPTAGNEQGQLEVKEIVFDTNTPP